MTAGDLHKRLAVLRDALVASDRVAAPVIKQLRRFAAMPPDERPFDHPYYWAGFTYSGA